MYRFLCAAVFVFAVTVPAFADGTIHVFEPWISEAPPTARVLAGYMVIHNETNDSATLLGITTPFFERVEFHLTQIKDDGTASMQKQDEITVPANSEFAFSPGEFHLMLFNPARLVKNGDIIPMELVFSNGESINIEAEVKRNDSATHHHH